MRSIVGGIVGTANVRGGLYKFVESTEPKQSTLNHSQHPQRPRFLTTLDLLIGVRIPASQLELANPLYFICLFLACGY
jgi:hypothetical protein